MAFHGDELGAKSHLDYRFLQSYVRLDGAVILTKWCLYFLLSFYLLHLSIISLFSDPGHPLRG